MYVQALQWRILESICRNGGIAIHGGEIEEKVVVLRELHRAIIYTTEMSNQVTKSHVRMQFTVYLVN
jgi:hypothetical protein